MEELINRAKNGDIVAYTEAFTTLQKDLERIAALNLKDKNYVQDIVQDVYCKAYEKIGTLDDSRKFRNWIITILRNECRNANKRASHHSEVDVTDYEETLVDTSIPEPDAKLVFEEMIKDLTEDEQRLIRMKYIENFSNTEIAEELGIPYNTVKSKILRAIKRTSLVLLVLIMLSGFTVLATFIIKQIKAHFTTSSNAINTAVENDYVQEIDSDFVYDNGIGIKVDAIVLDDKNLDISFVYDVQDKEKYGEITEIGLKDYIIKSEDEILYDSNENEKNLAKGIIQDVELFDNIETNYINSILLSSKVNFPKIRKILIEIKSIYIKSNEKIIDVVGTWDLEHDIIDKLNERNVINYVMEENEYVKESKVTLMDTFMQFDMYLTVQMSFDNIEEIVLSNNRDIEINCSNCSYDKKIRYLSIIFDIGKYTGDIDELNLKIPIENYENIIINFRRDE